LKDVYNFVVWQWSKWKPWQKVYVIAMTSVIIGFLLPGIIGALLLVLGLTSLLSWLFKWAVWDSITTSYNEFKKEKEDGQDKNQ
jgi:hypothetical protein